jgi:hypothetical protein
VRRHGLLVCDAGEQPVEVGSTSARRTAVTALTGPRRRSFGSGWVVGSAAAFGSPPGPLYAPLVMPEEPMPQSPTFRVSDRFITISNRDGKRLVAALPVGSEAAAKIEQAMQLGESTDVELGIGEDQEVIAALADLEAEGDFLSSLSRLQKALNEKIEREG